MKNELKKSIAKLREEEKKLGNDVESRERLNKIISELEKQVDNKDGAMENLSEYIDDSIAHFETTHPAITAAINRVADILSNLGI